MADEITYSPAADRLVNAFAKRLEEPDPYRIRRGPRPDDDPTQAAVRRMLADLRQLDQDRYLCRLLGSPDGGRYVWLDVYFNPITAPVLDYERGPGATPTTKMIGVSGPPTHQDHPIETPLVRNFPTYKIVRAEDGTEKSVLAHPVLDERGRPVLNLNGRPTFVPDQRGEPIKISIWAPIPHGVRPTGEPWWGYGVIVHDKPLTNGERDDITEWSFAERVLISTCGPTGEDPRPRTPTLEGLQAVLTAYGWTPDLMDPPEIAINEREMVE